jgi:sortase A
VTPALRRAGTLVLLAVAAWHGGRAAWIAGKARLAQHLVRDAWGKTLAGAGEARPWPWADTHPVARLVVPGRGVDVFVLAGASGRTMAFGPGHLSGTPRPGEPGNSVVSGHRDTHFAFLRRLRDGDAILVERRDGRRRRYVVDGARVVDHRETWVARDAGDTRLTLVTCYPFDALRPGGSLRYVVTALLAGEQADPALGHTPHSRRHVLGAESFPGGKPSWGATALGGGLFR